MRYPFALNMAAKAEIIQVDGKLQMRVSDQSTASFLLSGKREKERERVITKHCLCLGSYSNSSSSQLP